MPTLNGYNVISMELHVGYTGPWYCDYVLDSRAETLDGKQILKIGKELELHGTIDPYNSGYDSSENRGRLIGGGGGWSKLLPPKNYRNDATIKTLTVVKDLIFEAGETLGIFEPSKTDVGKTFVRARATAATSLEAAIADSLWRVDYSGKTNIFVEYDSGEILDPNYYTVASYTPDRKIVELIVTYENLHRVSINQVIQSEKLLEASKTTSTATIEPLVIRDLTVIFNDDKLVVACLCSPYGSSIQESSKLADLLDKIIERKMSEKLYGVYQYRVTSATGNQVNLQPTKSTSEFLPDLKNQILTFGIPGATSTLTPGDMVLIGFIAGDRSRPYVQTYRATLAPVALSIGGPVAECLPAARQTDEVTVTLPSCSFEGTIGGSPATGTLTWSVEQTATGTITGGSSKIKIG